MVRPDTPRNHVTRAPADPRGAEPPILAGRFELREVLGSGGMATVYRAWDRERQQPCAVKALADHLSRDEEFRRRFEREAEAARGLVHPHIVAVYAYGDADALQYMAMECVEGGTLRDLLRRGGPLPEAAAVQIAAEVADALAYAHSRRVVHRDIKPHNILLTGDGHVKVADFGIARTLDATLLTRTGSVLGSTQYISPEQVRGDQAGPASDQYSLGVVLYEALAGRLPFEGETPVAIALKHLNDPPFDLQWIRPDLSPATVAIVRRLLAKSAQDRYPTAADLAADLRRLRTEARSSGEDTVVLSVPEFAGTQGTRDRPVDGGVRGPVPPENGGLTTRLPAALPAESVSDTRSMRITSSRSPLRRGRAPAALAALAVVGVAALGASTYRGHQSTLHVRVPSLVGKTVAAAQQIAVPLHLGVAVTSQRQDPRADVGVILSQNPPPGRDVVTGTMVQLTVSQGSGIVPDLRGLPISQAQRRLRAVGLLLGRVSYSSDAGITSGAVISQSAAPAAHVTSDGSVDVVVSDGSHQSASSTSAPPGQGSRGSGIVPDLGGLPVSQAEQQLQAAGLRLGHVSYTYDDRAASGSVIHQLSAPGTRLPPNGSVDVLVSQGSPPSPPSPAPAPTTAPNPDAPTE